MNIKPSWDTTGDLLETVDPRPQNPIFVHTQNYTKKVVESYSIQDFDLNVLVQNESKGSIRTVAEETIYKSRDISGYKAIPLYDLESKLLIGYQLLDRKKKSQPIKVGTGIPVCNFSNANPTSFIATDNLNLFFRLSQLNYVVVFHSRINTAFELINNYFDDQKPRIVATEKHLEYNNDLKIHFDSDVSNLSDEQIKSVLKGKSLEIRPAEVKNNSTLQIVNMSSIKAQAINWLWTGWLPLGKITILAGAGGCGKTNLLLALIATISTNGVFPDGSKCNDSGKILIYSTEDDPNDTLLPRLIANGADLNKIDFIAGRINEKGEREPFDPTKDLPLLYEYAKRNPDIKLLMIDPIISAVGGDSNKATDVRRSLQVLVDFAQEFNCAVVGITHFAKGTSGSSPAERIIGSQAFTALARMVWSAAKREDENDCILVRAKSNISTLDGGIRYQIEAETVLENIETTKTAWLGVIEGSARELLNEAESTENDNGSMVDMAKEFLIDLLSSVENMPTKEVQAQAKDAGFSPASIRRAQEKLNIKPFKPQGEKVWFWSLPKIHRLDEPTHF
ncbi:AAA family ATPase [Acinetobacter sp. Marseille-Q1618]|uniref:AAA family ATPase n=1 Tax=Acinetobacter sp. Marseille-Q1618 TaxID=2697502 RepID=UPI0015710B86|nr:AAA family ATPase [Acinetobacter sp. Marseille-Q1618]